MCLVCNICEKTLSKNTYFDRGGKSSGPFSNSQGLMSDFTFSFIECLPPVGFRMRHWFKKKVAQEAGTVTLCLGRGVHGVNELEIVLFGRNRSRAKC